MRDGFFNSAHGIVNSGDGLYKNSFTLDNIYWVFFKSSLNFEYASGVIDIFILFDILIKWKELNETLTEIDFFDDKTNHL